MKIVFLDMDGVLNSAEYFAQRPYDRKPIKRETDAWWLDMIDPAPVELLNEIIEQSGAKVVISSSWRYHRTPADMQRLLNKFGFKGEVIGRTPLATEMPKPLAARSLRGLEVEVWLAKNRHLDVEAFCILDDMGALSFAHMTKYLVQTKWSRGLQADDLPEALTLLAGEKSEGFNTHL